MGERERAGERDNSDCEIHPMNSNLFDNSCYGYFESLTLLQ